MLEQDIVVDDSSDRSQERYLQRRVLRLLLQHHETVLRKQFSLFFVDSTLPPIPLLQQYDRLVKLRTLSNELLNDIIPRIRRQLSLKTSHSRLYEEAPTRGDIDWTRSLERNMSQQSGLPLLQFETNLRQRKLDTPENVLVVAILLAFRQEIQLALSEQFEDEELNASERQTLVSADEQAERELAAASARTLAKQAAQADLPALVEQVTTHLRPGPNPYRDLLGWWQRFNGFRIGRASGQRTTALVSKRTDEKTTAWLYELWIILEILHLLSLAGALQPDELQIATDKLQCLFSWQDRRFRLLYNRQLDTSTCYEPDWEYGPPTRPDYTIERIEPLEIRYDNQLIWREPPIILDAKYYLARDDAAHTHEPIKKLLGDMTLLRVQHAALFFPLLPEPPEGEVITRTIRQTGKQYTHAETQQIHLFHLEPQMSPETLHTRLHAILDFAADQLPERPTPVCQGMMLDSDTLNASTWTASTHTVMCPKPHIGPGVFDLVNVETDCLKNPRLCHVMDQAIVPPFVLRVVTQEELERQCQMLRTRSNELLKAAEQIGDDIRAERIRKQIFTGIGQAVEQYIRLFGNTTQIENKFREWVFGRYWQEDARSLAETTRRSLLSGEHIWENYSSANVLQDWAAPAIQYCRILEFELKRRLYSPIKRAYTFGPTGFTLGAITHAYNYRGMSTSDRATWNTMLSRIPPERRDEFEHIVQRMSQESVYSKRNKLAHGEAISKEVAASLRDIVIGNMNQPGILRWLAEHVDPA